MYNILVCDDEKDIVSALKIYLGSEGYTVFAAYNGKEALEILDDQEIHLVLLDLMMPVMDGMSVMIEIRKKSNVPVILLTAKIVAICLAIVSAFTCLASAAAVIAADYMNVYSEDEATVLARVNERFLDRYSVYAMANYKNGNKEAVQELDQTNFRYGIIRTDDFDAMDLNDPKSYVISNIDRELDRNDVNLYSCNWSEYTDYA